MADKHFRVKLKRSGIGRPETQKKTLKGLGLTRFGKTVSLKDTRLTMKAKHLHSNLVPAFLP